MARKARMPKASMPKPGSATTSSTVRNVSNTGEMSTSSHTTGATGASTNHTQIISSAGTPGASGSSSASFSSVSPSVTWDGGTNFKINPDLGVAPSAPPTSDAVRGAFTRVEGELAAARQRALGMVPAEYRDRVNASFDNASNQVSEHKKRFGY